MDGTSSVNPKTTAALSQGNPLTDNAAGAPCAEPEATRAGHPPRCADGEAVGAVAEDAPAASPRGGGSGNTHLAKRQNATGETGGEDTVHLSLNVWWREDYEGLMRSLETAQGEAQFLHGLGHLSRGGNGFAVRRGGYKSGGGRGRHFRYQMSHCGTGIAFKLTDEAQAPEQTPNVLVELGSVFLMASGGIGPAWAETKNILESLGGYVLWDKLSRLDVCADLPGQSPEIFRKLVIDREQSITRAATQVLYKEHGRATGVNVGAGAVKLRIYDKAHEVNVKKPDPAKRGLLEQRRWGGPQETALRVEYQLRRAALKELEADTLGAYFQKRPAVVRYLTWEWFRIAARRPDRKNHNVRRETVHGEWRKVQAAFAAWAGEAAESARRQRVPLTKDPIRLVKQAVGCALAAAAELDGMLFYKVDRAARNLFDYVEIERIEAECNVPVIYVAQPTENSPAGRMQRRILSNMASFYTEQQSVDVREGMQRRVESGWFAGKAPFGYRNARHNGRGVVEVHEAEANAVRTVFYAYAGGGYTLDTLLEHVRDHHPDLRGNRNLSRSGLHRILMNRSYLGEVPYQGRWYAGQHKPLVDRVTFERVQARLGGHIYQAHDLPWAGEIIRCRDCGRPVTGERKTKRTRTGETHYTYYRCARYSAPGHVRWSVREQEIESQFHAVLASMKVGDPNVAAWFRSVIEARAAATQETHARTATQNAQQLAALRKKSDSLLDLRINGEIDTETFQRKSVEMHAAIRDLEGRQRECKNGTHAANALRAFELSQALADKWVTATAPQKRKIVESVCLNCTLDGVTLNATMKKPFDLLAKGLILQDGRGERI